MDDSSEDERELELLVALDNSTMTIIQAATSALIAGAAYQDSVATPAPSRRTSRRTSRRASRRASRRQTEPVTPQRPTTEYVKFLFDFESLSEQKCKQHFRFNKTEIKRLLPFMGLCLCKYEQGIQPSEELAICIWLNRLSWPNKIHDMPHLFGVSPGYVDIVYNAVLKHFKVRFLPFLLFDSSRLTIEKIREYADVIGEDGKIWAFIDGTTKHICRPTINQEVSYTGHKAYHAYKWQAVVTPDGLCSSLAGPENGSRSDWRMYERSGIREIIQRLFTTNNVPDDERPFIYGDAAYTSSTVTMGPWRRPARGELTAQQRAFNKRLSKKRVSVENFFAMVQNSWSLSVMHTSHRLGSSPVGLVFASSAFLENCKSCLRGSNQVSRRFGMPPPSLEEYLSVFDIRRVMGIPRAIQDTESSEEETESEEDETESEISDMESEISDMGEN
ncbi:hypothetical protein AAP_05817 [Ascosphaera apis ARSEF 7405]|uniref:DDE Tnp4 domain-containing protein n=1 Tax=Ascosphaera apis ARSEF 7405 TaxID=392613 RepID=A0A162I151_9EURO|nr:hypothetical protein AAP_05817 [Ascosphaera apis ARSEF 7405]